MIERIIKEQLLAGIANAIDKAVLTACETVSYCGAIDDYLTGEIIMKGETIYLETDFFFEKNDLVHFSEGYFEVINILSNNIGKRNRYEVIKLTKLDYEMRKMLMKEYYNEKVANG